ncbi:MAG: cytochrome c-type biogenesis protein CcmH [Alphaproteobacteria bacterium]|nr:cytochrome c-type biogenesis protein CcmH [Alphaproteobacteria bacterium]
MRIFSLILVLIAISFGCADSWAQIKAKEEPMPTPKQEEQAQDIFKTLRCMVCEGQSIDASKAELAVDMRVLIRDMLKQGKTEDEIRTYLVGKYGETITMKIGNKPGITVLILLPFIVLLMAMIIIMRKVNSKREN